MPQGVVEIGPGQISYEQTGRGPDLVLVHSLLTDRHGFDPVVPALARQRRVTMVDLPGFGASTPVAPEMSAYADAVGAFLGAGGFDPASTAVLANGLGAFVALGTAIRHGGRFERLCLVGCGLSFPPEARSTFAAMASRVEEEGMEAVVDVAVRRIFPESHLAAHPEVVAERRDVLLRTTREAFVGACSALQSVDFRAEAEAVTMPSLIVVGSEDEATPPAMAREAHAAIAGSRLVEIAGVGHAPQLQDPPRFLDAVTDFLASDG